MKYTAEEVINHLIKYGFIFQGSQIYGGFANTWDFGPLGVEVEINLKKMWWEYFVRKSKFNVGLDSSIFMNNNVWKASGHVDSFFDSLLDCKNCKLRFRIDELVSDYYLKFICNNFTNEQLFDFINEKNILCPNCGMCNFTKIRQFELMFKTYQGVVKNNNSMVYLRPETAQGIFINFKNIQRSLKKKLPFGVGQIGKSFRNEITPGNFIFRTREFEQMELEFFFDPNDKFDWFKYWLDKVILFLNKIGLRNENYSLKEYDKKELAHYAKRTIDIEYKFPFGENSDELWGISDRGNFDLSNHIKFSKEDLFYFNKETNQKIIPCVIEPSVGVGRLLFAVLYDAYNIEKKNNKTRVVLKLHPLLSPYQIAIIPLKKQLNNNAYKLFEKLLSKYSCVYDEKGDIGRSYYYQDAIGTPFCITYDFNSLNDNSVTIRNRDTMRQERIKIIELEKYLDDILDSFNLVS